MVLDRITFIDEKVRRIAMEIATVKCAAKNFVAFVKTYLSKKHIEEIDWIKICEESKNHNGNRDGWKASASLTIYFALKLGYYCGSHKQALIKLFPYLGFLTNPKFHRHDRFLCGSDVDYLMIVQFHYGKRSFSFMYYYGTNDYVRQLLCDALNSEHRSFWRALSYEMIEDFEKSLGEYARIIKCESDFSDRTFLTQMNYYKNKYRNDEKRKHQSVIAVASFYRYLCYVFPKSELFGKDSIITQILLLSPVIHRLVLEDYRFCRINPFDDFGDDKKYCFITSGPYSKSTRTIDEGYIITDLSLISSPSYRRLVVQYLQSIQRPFKTEVIYIARALSFLESIKAIPGYSNPDLLTLNNTEANALISFFTNHDTKENSLNIDDISPSAGLHISLARSFFLWCKDAAKIVFEDNFFKVFKPLKYTYYKGGNPADEQNSIQLAKYLEKKSHESLKDHLVYIVFLILMQTEMRVSHILRAKVSSLIETIKADHYTLRVVTKTSHGEEVDTDLAPQTVSLFKKAIAITEEVRKNCNIPALSDFIFLYQSSKTRTTKISSATITQSLLKASRELGFTKAINSKVLRDTHATNANKFLKANKLPETDLTKLTGHASRAMDENHYLDYDLVDMLEAAYGVSFTEEYDSLNEHVVKDVQINNDSKHIVQEGCGVCEIETCSNTGIPLCLLCKHFVTTVNHLPYFKKAIDDIDHRISVAKTRHDIEDLVSLKEVFVKYLSVIYEKIENNAAN